MFTKNNAKTTVEKVYWNSGKLVKKCSRKYSKSENVDNFTKK